MLISYPFKILDANGKERSIDETLHNRYLENVKRIEERYDVKLPHIQCVQIGNESCPITSIYFPFDIELYADESLFPGKDQHNEEQIQLYKLRRF